MFLEIQKDGEQRVSPIEPWRQLLLDAADYIECHGWVRARIGTAGGPVCAVGAMWMAFQGNIPTKGDWDTGRSIDDAMNYLGAYVRTFGYREVATFNDARSGSEVIAAMRSCAFS